MKERIFVVKISNCPEGMNAKDIAFMFQDEFAVFPEVTEKMESLILLNPNCSESVTRYYTLEPEKIQKILQAIKDEIVSKYPEGENAWLHPNEKIPLFEKAEMYDSRYVPNECDTRFANIEKTKATEKGSLRACAGLGDNDAIITVDSESFTLNIGNNDIQPAIDGTVDKETKPGKKNWIEIVEEMGIKVQEAEFSEELDAMARDCCCGITWFDGYDNLIKDPDFGKLLQKAGLDVKFDLPAENPNRKTAEELLDLFRIWRIGKQITPHLTTVEDAKRFLKEQFTASMHKLIIKNRNYRGEDINISELERKRKRLMEKYKNAKKIRSSK